MTDGEPETGQADSDSMSRSSEIAPSLTTQKRVSDSATNNCAYCGKLELFPSRCPKCGGKFCAAHREPEGHECPDLVSESQSDVSDEPAVIVPSYQPSPQSLPEKPAVLSPPPFTAASPAARPAKKFGWRKLAIFCVIIAVTLVVLGGIGAVGYSILFPPVWSEQLPFKNSTGQYDTVTKYRNATDVSSANLSLFLASISPALEASIFADSNYRPVEYAVLLHDEAQRRQINCTIIGTDMAGNVPGHALVAFHTTDGGMVYADLTAMNVSASDYAGLDFSRIQLLRQTWRHALPPVNASEAHPEATERRDAKLVSYAGLESFLAGDSTENRTYEMPSYTCLDFAVNLHDRAEGAGIKNGIVAVSFEGKTDGHAFNVFPTTDKGLVYIDSTGLNRSRLADGDRPTDNVIYLDAGEELGALPITQVAGHLDYSFYLDRKARIAAYHEQWKQYSDNLTQYNAEVADFNNQSAANNRFYDSYQAECNQYSAAVAEYNRQMDQHNQAILTGSSSVPPVPSNLAELQAWQSRLNAKYDQYSTEWSRLDRWSKELDKKLASIKAWRSKLVNAEEYNWITYTPPGIVDEIEVYWG